jgi:hypothetical protein
MCRKCLEESLKRHVGPDAQQMNPRIFDLYTKFYANAVAASLKAPDQHLHRIVKRCSHFQFQIQDADGDASKVSYTSMRRHDYEEACDQFTLESFLSDDHAIVGLFKNEVEHCRAAIDHSADCHTAEGFHAHIRKGFAAFGVEDRFDAALSELMEFSDFRFH